MSEGMVTAVHLRVNDRDSPLGMDESSPRFSWQLDSTSVDVIQAAWRIQVALTLEFDGLLEWDSGRTDGDLPFGVRYRGEALRSATRYYWRVQAWDASGRGGQWSEPASFETGMFESSRWSAEWISAPDDARFSDRPIYLRGLLDLTRVVTRARAYSSALGWYRFFVNGHDMTGPALVPRFTPFNEIVEYQVYDVTNALREGSNIFGLAVADGRFRGHVGFFDRRAVYGGRLAGFLQLELEFADSGTLTWTTGSDWSAGLGRITESDPKLGEKVDLRVPDDDWLSSPSVPERFVPAVSLPRHSRRLIAEELPRVTEIERFRARVWRSPSGKQLIDLGQNLAGILRIRLSGESGSRVQMTFGEALTPEGEFAPNWIIQNAKKPWHQRDEVVLDGNSQWWQPWFTIHGFRYVEIVGLTENLTPQDVEGVALSSDVQAAGDFAASDERLTRLWKNVYWSTRSNFTDTATDCPTRERSGWTGDIQVFTPTATGMVESLPFLRRYMRNVAIEQKSNGNVSPWIPSERSGNAGLFSNLVGDLLGNSVGWGDVTVITPWDLYRYYGDRAILEAQYVSMQRWVDRLQRAARRPGPPRWFSHRVGRLERFVLDSGFHWGEWLRPGEAFPSNFLDGSLHGAVVATAYFEHSSRLLARISEVLEKPVEAERYLTLADSVRDAWRAAFLRDGGRRIGRDLQDDYVRAIGFNLLDEDENDAAAQRLVELIDLNNSHLGTGFLSTAMLLPALVRTGHSDTAYRLLRQNTAPSWLHEVEEGATTIWETWEGFDATGHARESHNHYALGSVAGWIREELVGISPLTPGYRRVRIAPVIGGDLTWASGRVATPFGTVSAQWAVDGPKITLRVTVPAGSEAAVTLTNGEVHDVGSGDHVFQWATARPTVVKGNGIAK